MDVLGESECEVVPLRDVDRESLEEAEGETLPDVLNVFDGELEGDGLAETLRDS